MHRPRAVLRTGLLVLALAGTLAVSALAQVLPPASPSAALAHVTALSQQIGPRPAGSANDARAADYIAGHFQQLGYRVERQPFPFVFFAETSPPALVVTVPVALTLAPVTMLYSAATPAEGTTADLVSAGLGRPEDFRDRQVQGRIVLVERGQIFFRQKVANAGAAGALAVVIYNNQSGAPQPGTLVERGALPAVMISQDEGRRLLDMLGGGTVRVRLIVHAVTEQRTSHNIIGIKPGTQRPGEIVVVGGHADSVAVSPGANDNGSGTAAVLEAARLLAGVPTDRTVHFVTFGAEELGLYGSTHYVRQRTDQVVGMINLDMVGRGDGFQLIYAVDGSVATAAERVGRALRINVRLRRERELRSDHAPFESQGIPAVFIFSGEDDTYHTPGDVVGLIDANLVAQAAALAAGTAAEIAGIAR